MHETGVSEFPSREGVPLIQATVASQRLGWASGVAVDRAALYAPLWTRAAVSGAVAAAAILSCLALVIGLGRRINSSWVQLARAVANLRRQKPTVERTGEPEIDSVIEAFNLTAAELSAHERQRAAHERQMQVAAREVSHRSKNLLAVTTAIAALLSRDAPDAKTFTARFTQRLQALARCQDLLIESNWTEALLENVIASQLVPFGPGRFDTSGEPVRIPAAAVQSLSMVFHELATNAAKYGALSVPGGRVAVGWSTAPAQANEHRMISIVWREIGGPPANEPGQRGFGSTVIAASCRQTLNGTLDLDFRPEGLVCSFTFPLRNPDDPASDASAAGLDDETPPELGVHRRDSMPPNQPGDDGPANGLQSAEV
jgi:two-component sensor histidine kinase